MVYGRLNWPTGADRNRRKNTVRAVPEGAYRNRFASDFYPSEKRGEELEWLLHTYPLEPGQKRTVYRSGKSGRQSEISGDFKYAYGVPETAFSIEKEKF